MAIYAVRCLTGEEIETKEKLKYVLKKSEIRFVKAIYAFETFTQKFRGKSTADKELKGAVPGYIFVETNDHYPLMRKELWHLIKSLPKVCDVFRNKIPEKEFKHFFDTCDVEADIEVSFNEKTRTDKQKITEEQKTLHEANVNGEEFEDGVTKTTVDKVNELKQKTKNNSSIKRIIKRCKAFVRDKKETFIFPFSLFHKTRDRIDPDKQMSVRELTDGDFIIPQMLQTLKMEVALE